MDMIRKLNLVLAFAILVVVANAQGAEPPALHFASSDTALQHSFSWAMATALSYKGKPGDPVGPWYESALPPRSAFCMRDVSHQSLGAAILGLDEANKNMLTLFAGHISGSKDWCTYWEMNKYGKPAPEDYRNDREFWYNLPANFDMMAACWKLYQWTGDSYYIHNPVFLNFFEKTATDYIKAWHLEPDSLLTRINHPNAPVPFDVKDPFHRCRGLASYSEGVQNIKMGVDLVAAIFRGLESYSHILEALEEPKLAEKYHQLALRYQRQIDQYWWDARNGQYNTYYSGDEKFGKTEGETFLLWFDALKDTTRKNKTIERLVAHKWNVENSSYLPLILYKNGYEKQGYDQILYLSSPQTERRSYPEVSYAVIEAIIQGLMGIDGSGGRQPVVSTFYQGPASTDCSLENLPIQGTFINVSCHKDGSVTLQNNGTTAFVWKALFKGEAKLALVNGTAGKLKRTLKNGKRCSYLQTPVAPGQKVAIKVR